ncbi:hypothetical protein MN116_007266 [Schistosoma mekongi]|uniref:Glycosyl hydrolase family 13 catalytic domain-containing protein n=1 Tax=Schistosoma mekongi TaxID=38744 RepID=A0AAE1ZAF5_SCHME|nr:hypothetical protein MN116_007266 [Schistosoma mekongi]
MSVTNYRLNYPNVNYQQTNSDHDDVSNVSNDYYAEHVNRNIQSQTNDRDKMRNDDSDYNEKIKSGPVNDVSAYTNDVIDFEGNETNYKSHIYDPLSPLYGMEPELIGFVQKHNVVMDDGAVVNKIAMLKKAALDRNVQKKFQPPGGLSIKTFITLIIIIALLLPLTIIVLTIGIIYAYKVITPDLPGASPWWRRTQIYQINVETWANDAQGPVGRLQDVIPRMEYLSRQIGATSILLTHLLNSDVNGIIDWETINQSIDPTEEAFSNFLPQLLQKAKSPLGKLKSSKPIKIMIGLPIYATSNRHEWFRSSQSNNNDVFTSFYMWTNVEPSTDQQKRHYAYDSIRRAYYRHVHGNPNSPLLNLTNPNVQTKMIHVIKFWKRNLEISGVMITNSSNLLDEMVPGIKKILNTDTDDEFIWFADEPKIDAVVNTEEKVCLQTLMINIRVPTRRNDLDSQIQQAMNNTQLRKCSPIWLVHQLSEDNKDFATIQKLAYFLPGSYLMLAGQEVDLVTGNKQLLKWSFDNYLDYTTYWPININLPHNGKQRLHDWRVYWEKLQYITLLNTPIDKNNVLIFTPRGTYNLLCVYRNYDATIYRIYFIVSFQTLNTIVHFQSIFHDLNSSPKMEVIYDSKSVYLGRRQFNDEVLVNNQILLLYYY